MCVGVCVRVCVRVCGMKTSCNNNNCGELLEGVAKIITHNSYNTCITCITNSHRDIPLITVP